MGTPFGSRGVERRHVMRVAARRLPYPGSADWLTCHTGSGFDD